MIFNGRCFWRGRFKKRLIQREIQADGQLVKQLRGSKNTVTAFLAGYKSSQKINFSKLNPNAFKFRTSHYKAKTNDRFAMCNNL
jgi:hypothetical protein